MLSNFEIVLIIFLKYGMPVVFITTLFIAFLYFNRENKEGAFKRKALHFFIAFGISLIVTSILTSLLVVLLF